MQEYSAQGHHAVYVPDVVFPGKLIERTFILHLGDSATVYAGPILKKSWTEYNGGLSDGYERT